MSRPSDIYAGTDLEVVHDEERAEWEREALRLHACWLLSTSLNVLRALHAGRPVPREAIDPWFADRLPLWGGFVDDAVALDVAVLDEVRLEGLPTPPGAVPQDVPAPAPVISLRDLGVLQLDETRPAKRRRR